MTTEKHWAADEAARDRLKAFGTLHGIDHSSGLLEILGVEKIHQYTGTEAEAVAAIAKWAKDNAPPEPPAPQPASEPVPAYEPVKLTDDEMAQYAEASKGLASSPVWIRMDARGNYDISVQTWLPPALTRVGLVYARQALEDYHTTFADVLVANGNGAQKPAPALTLVPPSGNGDTRTFTPQTLKYDGKSQSGSLYWKCIGPPFTQYGVTIWEETLPDELKQKSKADLSQDLDITGWMATYTQQPSKNDPDRLVPDKVVKLTKAA